LGRGRARGRYRCKPSKMTNDKGLASLANNTSIGQVASQSYLQPLPTSRSWRKCGVTYMEALFENIIIDKPAPFEDIAYE